ncbi:MAG: sigma-54 dependent transcriptional regulator, partial [Bacteroidota bacterium]
QATVYSACNHSRSKVELEQLKSRQSGLSKMLAKPDSEIIGNSPAMREIFRLIDKVGPTDANVLITGENGTGKELIAKAIHQKSERADQVFIKVDLGAVAETLFESELFGHKKGAFTDAKEDRTGRFELANRGTLFLDEIGNLSAQMQAKLLTAIQAKEIVRVGENKPVEIDCRIVSATNSHLSEMVEQHLFRSDLLYRLNTVEVKLPPLRDRKEDIPLLCNHYINIFSNKYRKFNLTTDTNLLKYLSGYSWPGNIRELQHAVERAVIMADNTILKKSDFLLDDKPVQSPVSDTYKLDEMEKTAIEQAIRKHHGNMSKAAKELGLGRTTIYRKIEKYGIKY